MKPTLPEISVVVLSYQRADLLRRTLRSLFAQRDCAAEILVVDNASTDASADLVKTEFPQARLIALEENRAIAGRNIGFRAAEAPLVLSLDNDIELEDASSLRRICDAFATAPGLAAVTLKITEEATGSDYVPHHWWHPRPRLTHQDESFATDHLNEAAVAFRRAPLLEVGGYYEALEWGGEEWDLSLALMGAGWELCYLPIPVLHLAPRGSLHVRADPRHARLIRNRCWIALRRLPWPAALAYALPRLCLWGVRALRYGYWGAYCAGVRDFLRVLPRALAERRPLSAQAMARLRAVRRGHPRVQGGD